MLVRQIDNIFPDGKRVPLASVEASARLAMDRLEYCFSAINDRYYFDGSTVMFDHLHGDHYATWLYFVSNQLFRDGASSDVCSKIFLLNKHLHSCDIFYQIELPEIFLLVHPVGTVLGRASYQDKLVVYQRCSVGSNHGLSPSIGRDVELKPGSAVLGECKIGDNVCIATNALVLDEHVPSNSTYFGTPKSHWTLSRRLDRLIWRN